MIYTNKKIFGSYLAGLWEGDGHITLSKNEKPTFHISFHAKDYEVAKKLLSYIKKMCYQEEADETVTVGSIRIQLKKNVCTLNIYSKQGLRLVVGLINGQLRTPKAYQINKVIDWLNSSHKRKQRNGVKRKTLLKRREPLIKALPISSRNLCDDAWPPKGGFIDADGSFGVEVTPLKRVMCRFRLAQRMMYQTRSHKDFFEQIHESSKENKSYKVIMYNIASYFGVTLNNYKQVNTNRVYYLVNISSTKSKKILREYIDKYPLLTSKLLDYWCWCHVDDLIIRKQHLTPEGTQKIYNFKNSMNNSRIYLNWDHLKTF